MLIVELRWWFGDACVGDDLVGGVEGDHCCSWC